MCGITGFLTSATETELEMKVVVARMADQLVHRGPDDSGAWADSRAGIALGHRRLSILDLSPDGHQPMHSESGRYVIVFNGEVYNFRELRSTLESKGHRFRGHSDTEVMLAAMEHWGVEEALPHFNGMFSFAVWDRAERQLHLVRDRLGEKPLYYGWMGQTFLFGSELKALIAHPDFNGDVNRDALALYLRYNCIAAPYCIYSDIKKLPPGTKLTLGLSNMHCMHLPSAYWSAEEAFRQGLEKPFLGTDKEATASLDALLRDAVKMRMIADVPLGAFLSGGVDSSAIVALMQHQSARPVKTFAIGFHDEVYNEANYAAAVARHLGTDHTELYVSADEALKVIPHLPKFYDEPFSDSSQIPTYLVSALARRYVTVSLSGDGGDELFGGYKRYFLWGRVWNAVRWLPAFIRGATAWPLRRVGPQRWNRVLRYASTRFPATRGMVSPGEKVEKLAQMLSAKDVFSRYQVIVSDWESSNSAVWGGVAPSSLLLQRCGGLEFRDFRVQMMFLDTVNYLPDDILVKLDRAAMAVSLEGRVPYLDHRVVEFAASLPLSMKLRNGGGKWILRNILYQYVPQELIERPKKGFSLPIAEWLRGSLRDWAEDLLDKSRLRQDGYFHAEIVRQIWEDHLSGRRDLRHHIWALLMFQAWLIHWGKKNPRTVSPPSIAASQNFQSSLLN
ncbi:MAG TPA: asparagine synthase (glutamine-hydrolyzing) [Candidatus Acidoferrum sp.]|nr:asparagine synthase (glutamine-hydrolyzing) [Candidatus Acidoferrum sp.]